jgi:hypothetical protein
VAVWTRETATRRAKRADTSKLANPIYLLAAITLGIPALLAIPLIGMNPGIQEGAFANIVAFFVVGTFVIAAMFEIKRLADQPSDEGHHWKEGQLAFLSSSTWFPHRHLNKAEWMLEALSGSASC